MANKFYAMGRLTRDPEVKRTTDDKEVSSFSLAVNRKFKREGEQDADFFNCIAFGKTAEIINKYMTKGSKVAIWGRVQIENYTDREGVKKSITKVYVDEIEFCESKGVATSESREQSNDSAGFKSVPDAIDEELPFN